ncbi:flavodoxin domain-containing protein [Clostridium perfringens]|uniref:flavodoxin domain-containing protein n=1 Tax=Clostridium perfringens TaxID=1502 RepID=UPI0018E41B9B|nr:flavodoxin domain-containing protein [Clostridium perfringens]MBI6108996.1 hypothetical protein [Clostridium perfringens]
MNVIIYGSKYGTAKQYAEKLSEKTNIHSKSYEDIEDINSYETIIYIGGLYAGGVLGMAKTFKFLTNCKDKKIIIATVGLADPNDIENANAIKASIRRQLSNDIYTKAFIYHLRGGIDYSKLSFKHKTMMALLYKKVKSLPEKKKTAEIKAMMETYNKQVYFVDYTCLNKIIEII